MTYNLLYLDDDPTATTIADGFRTTGLINITVQRPTEFESQLEELIAGQEGIDGLILDLKLDDNLSGERKARYTATSLASLVRSKVKEKVWKKEFPIFLFTTISKSNNLFSSDANSRDLFDWIFLKEEISNSSIQFRIHAIIEAYSKIGMDKPNLPTILDLENLSRLDKRIFPSYLDEFSSVFNFSRYILNELIVAPGPLIDEYYLSSRLGCDVKASEDWDILKNEILKEAKYSGVFSNAFDRWWMYKLNDWWQSIEKENTLASLDARERVEILSERLGLKRLIVAEPIKKSSSYRYWTVCQGFNRPLDPREGLRIDEKDPLPWQETRYISIEAALERVRRDQGLKVHPLERERFNDIKKTFS
jgi:hypothetical protein